MTPAEALAALLATYRGREVVEERLVTTDGISRDRQERYRFSYVACALGAYEEAS